MFVSDRVVFLELHKTGCTHIRNILSELLDGQLIGKHNQAHAELLGDNRSFLGSVRNPWEWYVSLWAYGCDSRGSVHDYLTSPRRSIQGLGWRSNPYRAVLEAARIYAHNPQKWKNAYHDVDDAVSFRRWLRMLHSPHRVSQIGEAYGATHANRVVGLLTFRYLFLFCTTRDDSSELHALDSYESVLEYDHRKCFVDSFIRNERLEADLFQGLRDIGIPIPEDVKRSIESRPKTNTSSRKHDLDYYYDHETAALVAARDRLIVEKFGYASPLT